MNTKKFGVIVFYNKKNPWWPFLIKPDEGELFIVPALYSENLKKDLKDGDRVSYNLGKWEIRTSSEINWEKKQIHLPVKWEEVNKEKFASNIEVVSGKLPLSTLEEETGN